MVSKSSIHSNMKILLLNIRSYNKNQDTAWAYIKNINCKFYIIVLTETQSTQDSEDLINDPVYKTFTKSRPTGRGEVVAILVSDCLQAQIIAINSTMNSLLEFLLLFLAFPCLITQIL